MTRRRAWAFGALAFALLASAALEIGIGPVIIPFWQIPADTWAYFAGHRGLDAVVVGAIRWPRLVVAVLAGCALALSGAVLQAILRNPMADPGVIGVSSGGALGAVIAVSTGLAARIQVATPALAFAFGLAVAAIIYRLATNARRTDMYRLLLAGVALSSLCSAIITAILDLSPLQEMQQMMFWLFGGLDGSNWTEAATLAAVNALAMPVFLRLAFAYDILTTGEEHAEAVGVDVERIKRVSLAVAALIVAVAVSTTGVISFIGLIVPHILRRLMGPNHRPLLAASALGGAVLLTLSDLVGRTAVQPAELNVGIVTSCLGVPFFVYLLYRHGRGGDAGL
ncbi:FecCD family ABC transporter permease [Alicyclobacillus acidocaldarius]|uniref:Transport system permease protein n=1 Tax=Alicyclobacillus acidocaldarius (strain Tc-4-1) TaxID=1048834 RepID=F8IER4_ALIAT|nr:iron ABC transporter permease [Alicyclobacillus acidocaldarius]AEJ43960.1 transport system permease protein [Alicyclobacillus acidocaldarius subsp. acidocaldarius Tc-4-1]